MLNLKDIQSAREWGRDNHLDIYNDAKFCKPGHKTPEFKEKQDQLIMQWHNERIAKIKECYGNEVCYSSYIYLLHICANSSIFTDTGNNQYTPTDTS